MEQMILLCITLFALRCVFFMLVIFSTNVKYEIFKWRQYSCMSYTFYIAILNEMFFSRG